MGRYISNMWIYPYYDVQDEIIHVILIGYPFAFFSVSSFYSILKGIFERFFPTAIIKPYYRPYVLVKILIFLTLLSIILPIIDFSLFNGVEINKIMVLCLIIGISSVSPIGFYLSEDSFLGQILKVDLRTIGALLLTSFISSFLHEIPNTYAWEWVYQNIPFTSFEVLNVNIIVLTIGWLFLTISAISVNEIFFFLQRIRESRTEKRASCK